MHEIKQFEFEFEYYFMFIYYFKNNMYVYQFI